MKERFYGGIEWTAEKSKKLDVLVGGVGLVGVVAGISGTAPVVAISIVSYFAGGEVEKWARKRSEG